MCCSTPIPRKAASPSLGLVDLASTARAGEIHPSCLASTIQAPFGALAVAFAVAAALLHLALACRRALLVEKLQTVR